MIQAVAMKKETVVGTLLEHGASCSAKNLYGQSPMDIAASLNLDSVTKLLQRLV